MSRAIARGTTPILAVLALCAPASAATWTAHSLPNPPGMSQLAFFGISCGVSTSCTAAGQDFNGIWGAHAESGAGGSWTPQTGVTRNPGPKNGLFRAASCTAATACMAVGQFGTSDGVPAMMAQRQNGTSWTMYNLGIPSGASRGELHGVSCRSTTWCMAVGLKLVNLVGTVPFPQARGFDGSTWIDTNAVSTYSAKLVGVSCASTTSCLAVGSVGSAPTAQLWNGFGWTTAPAPPVPGSYSTANLTGVSCVSASWCMATGTYKNSSGLWRPFADIWNGASWSTTPAVPWGGNLESVANGISCVSTTSCWIVGEGHFSVTTPWAVEWTGTTWSSSTVPTVAGSSGGTLRSVSCTAVNHCEAAGSSMFGSAYAGLIETLS